MTKIEKITKDFQALSFEDKKAKLINIFEGIKGKDPIFDEVLNALHNNPNVDEEFLISSYEDVMILALGVEKITDSRKIETMGKTLKENMDALHEREEKERGEENPDAELEDMLKNL